jgi:hypothetical protein
MVFGKTVGKVAVLFTSTFSNTSRVEFTIQSSYFILTFPREETLLHVPMDFMKNTIFGVWSLKKIYICTNEKTAASCLSRNKIYREKSRE